LWIARALVTACGAVAEAHSAGQGQGAVFSLLLPVQANSDADRPEDADD
jgi:hypothetical protein